MITCQFFSAREFQILDNSGNSLEFPEILEFLCGIPEILFGNPGNPEIQGNQKRLRFQYECLFIALFHCTAEKWFVPFFSEPKVHRAADGCTNSKQFGQVTIFQRGFWHAVTGYTDWSNSEKELSRTPGFEFHSRF
jgi:hypothetical protein